MMKKKQSHWWRMIWIAVTIPLVGFTLMAFSKPKEALKEVVDNTVRVIEQPIAEMMNAEVADSESVPAIEESEVSQPADKPQPVVPDVNPDETITGKVSGQNGEPLQLANIVEIDEYGRVLAHAQTDANGKFSLKVVNPKHKLRFSYVGYKTKTLDISGEKMDVVLEQAMQLTDVQVVAYRANTADADSSRYQEHAYPNEDGVFQVVEQAPKYPGETEGIMTYLSRNLRYPSVAREMQVEAEVVVRFTVDKTGLVRSPQVVNVNARTPLITAETAKAAKDGNPDAVEASKNYYDAIEALKEEAIHVVRNMPRWEPGRQNGKRIDTTYTLPINFKLQ